MGWSKGTEIFDETIKNFNEICRHYGVDFADQVDFNVNLINALEDCDWDTQNESEFWDDPATNKAFRDLHPNWDFSKQG